MSQISSLPQVSLFVSHPLMPDMRLLKPLATQGRAMAQFNLGVMYAEGQGVPQDYAEALKWYRMAAAQGLADAQFNLGAMYAEGQGVPQDDAEALKWYRLAAAQGDAVAPIGKDREALTLSGCWRAIEERVFSASMISTFSRGGST
jgi:TPR repeat protein